MAKTEAKKLKIGDVAREAIREGKSNEEALEIVKKQFPDAKTSIASISWYRGQMRAAGEKVEASARKGAAKKEATTKALKKAVAKKKVVKKKAAKKVVKKVAKKKVVRKIVKKKSS